MTLVAYFAAGHLSAQDVDGTETLPDHGADVFQLDRGALTSQSDTPYLFLGKVLDETHPRWREFRRAIRKYDTTISCLDASQRDEPVVDILAVDWTKFKKTQEVAVCVFRIASSLATPEHIVRWFELHDFRVSPPSRYRNSDDRRIPTYPTKTMIASWPMKTYYEKVPSFFHSLTGFSIARSLSITILFSDDDTVVQTGVTLNTL